MTTSPQSAIVAQCESFAGKMPAFYASIVACMIAQIAVFYDRAPIMLSLIGPAAVAIVAAVRMVWWVRRRRRPFTEDEARASLGRAKGILIVSTAVIVVMDSLIFQYLDELGRAFLLIEYLGCTMTGMYCLMHVRSSAYFMLASLMVCVGLALPSFPPDVAWGIAATVVSLSAAMIYAMNDYYMDFVSLIGARNEARALGEENVRLANLDMLTGLPNRRQFFADLGRACDESRGTGRRVAVAIADLDGFKPINDTHGHVVGDRVLTLVAERLAANTEWRAYRLGGDEFALIAQDASLDAGLIQEAERLIADVRRPIGTGDIILATGCSVGLATYPDLATTPELLYERADYALYHAKRTGRNKALCFTLEHEQELRAQSEIEQALRAADMEAEFYLVYQPIVHAADGHTLGFECLARWRSPTLGEVPPMRFIPVAEQSGLISTLTPCLLRKALADAARWPSDVKLSFNLSPQDIASRERTLVIMSIIGQSRVSPNRIDLELTETALLHNFEEARQNMAALRAIGVRISLDDFGTGYSSLSHIHALPLDKVKIDRSFVRNMEESESSRTIVGSIMTLCRDLRLACIVEGVETDGQLRTLSALGCEQVQGYLFSPPIGSVEVVAFLGDRLKRAN